MHALLPSKPNRAVLRYLSIFSGIEGATAAIERIGLGWETVAFAETDPAACAVLKSRWPDVPNLGDVRLVDWGALTDKVDVLIGGPPCQDFSVAGRQAGSAGARGALMGEYLRVIQEVRPRWAILENVPGFLSTGRGRDFGALLGKLAEFGYSAAWRVLDARHWGVPQRRRRLWIVLHNRHTDGPERVLDLCNGGARDLAEGGEEGEVDPSAASGGIEVGSLDRLIGWRRAARRRDPGCDRTALAADYRNATLSRVFPTLVRGADGVSLNAIPGVIQLLHADTHNIRVGGIAQTLRSDMDGAASHQGCAVIHDGSRWLARRLTPTECLRLQGFDDDWLDGVTFRGKPLADSHIYKLIGNAWAVPCAAWILERLAAVDSAKV